ARGAPTADSGADAHYDAACQSKKKASRPCGMFSPHDFRLVPAPEEGRDEAAYECSDGHKDYPVVEGILTVGEVVGEIRTLGNDVVRHDRFQRDRPDDGCG